MVQSQQLFPGHPPHAALPSIWARGLIGILGRSGGGNGMWGPQKHLPNCDHLSSRKTQTLIWTWLGTAWAGEVWEWGEEASMKLILCLSPLECQ